MAKYQCFIIIRILFKKFETFHIFTFRFVKNSKKLKMQQPVEIPLQPSYMLPQPEYRQVSHQGYMPVSVPPPYTPFILMQPVPVMFGRVPQAAMCPSCRANVNTKVAYKPGIFVIAACIVCVVSGGCLGCCLLPCFLDCEKFRRFCSFLQL